MVDWKSQEELAKDAIVFVKLNHTLFGLYIWEFVISLDFDWAVLTRKKKFRWPLIFYFANRYFLLFSMIGTSIAYDSTSKLDCRALYTFDELSGVAAVGLASINLSLRTVAIWSHNKWIIMLLVAIVIGHWSLILRGALVVGVWVPGVGCQITHSNTTILSATFIYSMCFDFIVMCLSAYKLAPMRRGMQGAHSQLIGMLFTDGLIYFITAFVANLLAATFMLLELNTIMSVIFNVPAATASTIVACRVVRRLADFQPSGPELFLPRRNINVGIPFKRNSAALPKPCNAQMNSGIHVEIDMFSHKENADPESIDPEDRKPTNLMHDCTTRNSD